MYEGKKIRLREYREDDLFSALKYLNDPTVQKMVMPGPNFLLTMNDEQNWFSTQSAFDPRTYNFAIETVDGEQYIGGCCFENMDWKNRNLELSIFIGDSAFRGKGYGTEVIELAKTIVFRELNMEKIKICVFSFNDAALKCYSRCGFQEEGRLKRECFRDGQYHDNIMMALFRDQYKNN